MSADDDGSARRQEQAARLGSINRLAGLVCVGVAVLLVVLAGSGWSWPIFALSLGLSAAFWGGWALLRQRSARRLSPAAARVQRELRPAEGGTVSMALTVLAVAIVCGGLQSLWPLVLLIVALLLLGLAMYLLLRTSASRRTPRA